MHRPQRRHLLGLLALPALRARSVLAQEAWPQRAVTLVVPLAPGGSTDVLSRALAQHLMGVLGQPVVVENRPGAGGTVAHAQVARARADGYTLLVSTNSSYSIAPHLYQLTYDPVAAFAPVTLIATTAQALCVHRDVPAQDLAGLIALAKARPGSLAFSSAGIGFTSHLAGELLSAMAGVSLLHVPYRGGGPASQALMAGEVQINFADTTTALTMVQGGAVRAFAVTGAAPSPQFPGVPTMEAAGLPGYRSMTAYALLAPAGTPEAVLNRLQAETVAWLRIPERREWLLGSGFEPVGSTAAEFRRMQATESAQWGEIIRSRGIRMP
jgi:tripartite-type tricarboxylate transporter receptor subunit TctC